MLEFVTDLVRNGKTNKEIAVLCSERYNLKINTRKIGYYRADHNIKSSDKYTPEVCADVRELIREKTLEETAQIINAKYNLSLTRGCIKSLMRKLGITTGRTGYFFVGSHLNKGRKLPPEVIAKISRFWFKKGCTAPNRCPVGTTSYICGYPYVKIKDLPNGDRREMWKAKNRYLWEQHYGPIPQGYNVVFLDGNPQNCVIENLALVSNAQLAVLNGRRLKSTNPELTKTGIQISKLITTIKEKEK